VLGELDADASKTARDGIDGWLRALDAWRGKVDLTAARSPDELVDLMLADAVVLARHIPDRATVVDVGTGAGAPGLPLALLRPDLRVTLVEPKHKRAVLLRTVLGRFAVGANGLLSVEVVQARAEQLPGRVFDVAVSRATLAPVDWLALGTSLAPAGEVWVLLARQANPEIEGWTTEVDLEYRWPLTGARRRAVCYRNTFAGDGATR
jgi:16S rRNA (guanine527-N7)-methyltransferase